VNSTVLYIEDNADNIRLIERLLKRRPHTELHVAMNGRDGVQAAIDQRPGLILLDNRLPDATGSEILRQLASAEATAGIPVIILTGDSGQAAADELLASGASEFLEKPFDIHQLIATIDRYLP
jgi:two-component system cell cycle response regulator DivK